MNALFENTCELIYFSASKRIGEKYQNWKEFELSKGRKADFVDFYPNNRKLISCILKNERTCDNPYLITPKIMPVLVEKLKFNDENELFWGNDVSSYLEDLFVTIVTDMNNNQKYSNHWNNVNLSTEQSIKHYFHKYLKENSNYLEKLTDDFIDFTYNTYRNYKVSEKDGIIFWTQQEANVNVKNKTDYLDFKYLPQKIETLADEIISPLLDEIMLEKLVDKSAEEN